MTYKQAFAWIGLSENTFYRITSNNITVGVKTLKAIANKMGIEV